MSVISQAHKHGYQWIHPTGSLAQLVYGITQLSFPNFRNTANFGPNQANPEICCSTMRSFGTSLLALILILLPMKARACSCAFSPEAKTPWKTAEWRFKGASVVFEGTADKMEIGGFHEKAEPGDLIPASVEQAKVEYTFQVSQVYKGRTGKEVRVATGFGGGDCGDSFEPDTKYVIYADVDEQGNLTTGICSGNFEVEGENATLRFLRKLPAQPQDNQSFRTVTDPIQTPVGPPGHARVCGSVLSNDDLSTADITIVLASKSRFGLRVAESVQLEGDHTFCMDNVEPGNYLLLAAAANDQAIANVSFYPGVGRQSEAKQLEVKKGDQITKLIFGFPQKKLPAVSGHVISRDSSLPEDGVGVILLGNSELPLAMPLAAKVEPDGSFLFPSVPAGHYELLPIVEDPSGDRGVSQWFTRKVVVDVAGDVREIQAELIHRTKK